MSRGWIGVDLDGTLAHYEGWVDETHIGEPIPLMADRVKHWIKEGKWVKIFTARVSLANGRDIYQRERIREAIGNWTELHLGIRLEAVCEKDYSMIQLWDDRCVQVIPNTGQRADGKE